MKDLYLSRARRPFARSLAAIPLVLLFLAWSAGLQAQVTTYSFASSSGAYTPITGGTAVSQSTESTTAITGLDDFVINLPSGTIPFTFTFNGAGYTGLNVSTNGFITFGATAPAATYYTPISGATGYAGAISAFGVDIRGGFTFGGTRNSSSNQITACTSTAGVVVGALVQRDGGTPFPNGTTVTAFNANTVTCSNMPSNNSTSQFYVCMSGEIRYQVVGTAPNREFVIQYRDFRPFSGTIGDYVNALINCQIRLQETTNAVTIVYGPTTTLGPTTAFTPQVGLRGASNTDFKNISVTTSNTWATPAAGGANTATCRYINTNGPTAGQTYTWTPPVPTCTAPSLSVGSVTANSASASWTCSGCTGTYVLEYGPSGYTPGTGATVGATGTLVSTTATSPTTISGLAAGTTYTVAVRQNCGAGGYSPNATFTITTLPGCGSSFTDSGGSGGNYAVNENSVTTICPQNAGDVVTVAFSAFRTQAGGDALFIYNGNSVGSPLISSGSAATSPVGGWNGNLNAAPPGPFTSTDPSGCLTFKFTSDASGTQTGWVAAVTCAPPCAVQTVPWSDSFEGATTDDSNVMPDCFVRNVLNTPTQSWLTRTTQLDGSGGSVNARTGTDYIYHTWDASSWLLTPGVALTAGTSYDFKYYYAQSDPVTGYTLTAAVGTTQNGASMTTVLGTVTDPVNNAYLPARYTFVAPTTGTYYFGVRATSPNTDPWYLATDDWSVTLTPACAAPSGVAVSNVTSSGATIDWTSNGALNYDYEVRTSGAPGSGGADASGNATTSPAGVSGLSPGTTYQLYLRSNCAGPVTGDWGDPTAFTTLPGCGSSFYDSGGPAGTYVDEENTITTICPTNPGDGVTVTFSAFDAEETFDALYVFDGPTTASPMIPSANGAPEGSVDVYGPGGYWGTDIPGPFSSTHTSGCLTFAFTSDDSFEGDGWEAMITCAPLPTCFPPSAISVTSITGIGAQLSWTNNSSLSYDYEVRISGNPGDPGAVAQGNVAAGPVAISGLSPLTAYTVYVRGVCTGIDVSAWASTTFTTALDCSAAILVSCGTPVSVTLSGTGNSGYELSACEFDVPGVERLYSFTAATAGSYQLQVTSHSGTTGQYFDYQLASAANGCAQAAFTCIDDVNAAVTNTLTLSAGTYFILVNPEQTASVTEVFQVNCPAPPPCVAAPTAPTNGAVGQCQPVVLSWAAPTAFPAVSGYDVYLDAGAGPATTLVSANQSGTTYTAPFMADGQYSWRVVPRNSAGTASGCSDWSFTLSPEPAGNRRVNAITINSIPASISGNNRLTNCFTNEFSTTSTPGSVNGRPGPDVFYKVTTDPCTSTLSARVCASTGGNPWIHLITSLGVTIAFNNDESPAVCSNTSSAAFNNVAVQPNTTYYIIVDGNGTGGAGQFDYTLDVTQTFTGGDADGDGTPDCADGCPDDPNKVDPGICGCGVPDDDADNDGSPDCFDSCLNGPEPGQPCTDHNPATVGDTQDESCTCIGTPLPTTSWNLQITTDANGAHTTWDITEQSTNEVLAGGGPFPNNSTINQVVDMPTTGNWSLNVHDSGNDGIPGGGYVLRDGAGNRIVDNRQNGSGFSALSSSPEGFSSEVGADQLRAVDCDNVERRANEMVMATPNPLVSAQWQVGNQADDGYEFWFFNPHGGYSRHVFRSHSTSGGYAPADATRACKLGLASFTVNPLPQNTLLNVRVRGIVNSARLPFGPACRLRVDPAAANCHTTQLENLAGPYFSCGVTGLRTNGGSRIYAKPVARYIQATNTYVNANRYRFHCVNIGESTSFDIVLNTYAMLIYPQYAFHLGATYDVTVQASFDGGASYCPEGSTCQISFAATNHRVDEAVVGATNASDLLMWPNPNRGDQLYLSMSTFDAPVDQVSVDIIDMFGKRVMSTTIPVSGGALNSMLQLDDQLASGLYLVNLTAGEQTITKRLVIQR